MAIGPFLGSNRYAEAQQAKANDRGKDFASEINQLGPPHLLRLVEAGSVGLEFNDAKLQALKKSAITEFHIQASFRNSYRIHEANQNSPESSRTVTVKYSKWKFAITHKVVLPSDFLWENKWYPVLLKHEFDHVAISSDPRIALIAERLFAQQDEFRVSLESDETQEKLIGRLVQERFDERKSWLQNWIQRAYDELDEISSNGLKAIDDRPEFFRDVHSEEKLRGANFGEIKRIQSAFRHKTYRDPDTHFKLLDLP